MSDETRQEAEREPEDVEERELADEELDNASGGMTSGSNMTTGSNMTDIGGKSGFGL